MLFVRLRVFNPIPVFMVKILYIEYEKKSFILWLLPESPENNYLRKKNQQTNKKKHCNMSMVKKQEKIDLNHPTLYFIGTDTKIHNFEF